VSWEGIRDLRAGSFRAGERRKNLSSRESAGFNQKGEGGSTHFHIGRGLNSNDKKNQRGVVCDGTHRSYKNGEIVFRVNQEKATTRRGREPQYRGWEIKEDRNPKIICLKDIGCSWNRGEGLRRESLEGNLLLPGKLGSILE